MPAEEAPRAEEAPDLPAWPCGPARRLFSGDFSTEAATWLSSSAELLAAVENMDASGTTASVAFTS